MFMCIGPAGAGKTVLLERLQRPTNKTDRGSSDNGASVIPPGPPITVPTVGTTLTIVHGLESSKRNVVQKSKRPPVCIREVGGQMAPIWTNYYDAPGADLKGVIFVVDASDPTQVSRSSVLLLTALADQKLSSTPFLVCLNKVARDGSSGGGGSSGHACTVDEIIFLLRLDDVSAHARQEVSVIQTSYDSSIGLQKIKDWLREKWNS